MSELISIKDAEAKGITKLRLPHWADKDDHLEFAVLREGGFGPWVSLWSRDNAIVGFQTPHKMIITQMGDLNDRCWAPYEAAV